MKIRFTRRVSSITLTALVLMTNGCGYKSNEETKKHPAAKDPTQSLHEIRIEEASQALLQHSVARLVTQLEINNKKVMVYQDSYSSFYDRIASSDDLQGRLPASLILYYTPHFVAGLMDVTPTDNDTLEVRILNKTSLRTMMDQIRTDLHEKIGAAESKAQLLQLPVSDVKATVRLFGKELPVQMAADFSQAVLTVSTRDLPRKIADNPTSDELRKGMSLFNIRYNYWVLPFNEDQCSLGIDTKVLKNIFVGPSASDRPEADAPPSENNAATVLAGVGRPVTIDMTRTAVETARKSMDARCTSSAGGMGWDSIGKLLNRLFEKGTDYLLDPNKSDQWDKVINTIVGDSMKPDAFRSTINSINNELNQGKSLSDAFNSSTDALKVAKALIENDSSVSRNQASTQNRRSSIKASGGGSYGPISGNASGATSNSSASSSSSSKNEAYSTRNAGETAEQYAARVNQALQEESHSMQLTTVTGNIQLVPKVRITLTNELNLDESVLAGLKATQLGVLKQEQGEVGADIETRHDLSLTIGVQCDANLSRRVIDLQSSSWMIDSNKTLANAIASISEDLNLGTEGACRQILISMGVSGESRLIPETLSFNINARKSATGGEEARSFSNALTLSPGKPTDSRTFGSVGQNAAGWSARVVIANAR